MERDFDRFSFGGELFSVGPLYTTELRSYIGRDEVDLAGNPIAHNNTMIHRLVTDTANTVLRTEQCMQVNIISTI